MHVLNTGYTCAYPAPVRAWLQPVAFNKLHVGQHASSQDVPTQRGHLQLATTGRYV